MTRNEAIEAIKQGKKITHDYFSREEFVTIAANGDDYLLEDGVTVTRELFWWDRSGEHFNDGWYFWEPPFNQEKEFVSILKSMKSNYGWDLTKGDKETRERDEALLHYAIKAIKKELINTPQSEAFEESVKAEMAHHLERWGNESNTPPHHFNMVIGFINGKLAKAIWEKDREKFEHHLITIAAVSGTAMKYLKEPGSEVNKWFENK